MEAGEHLFEFAPPNRLACRQSRPGTR
jgi:hypothetical protein